MAALNGSATAGSDDVDTSEASELGKESVSLTSPEFVPEDLLRHVDYLCRPELEGRNDRQSGRADGDQLRGRLSG